MPCEINAEPHGLYVRFSGVVSVEDIVALADAMQRFRAVDCSYRISDWLAVTEFNLSDTHIEHMISLDYVLSLDKPSMRKAVVASEPALVRKFESWKRKSAQQSQLQVFPSLEAARTWVTQPVADFEIPEINTNFMDNLFHDSTFANRFDAAYGTTVPMGLEAESGVPSRSAPAPVEGGNLLDLEYPTATKK
jgi:hypothetical protein